MLLRGPCDVGLRVLLQVHLAALPRNAGKRRLAGRPQAVVAVADDQPDAAQGPVGGGAGLPDQVEGRGHDTVHQAVVQARAHEDAGLPDSCGVD